MVGFGGRQQPAFLFWSVCSRETTQMSNVGATSSFLISVGFPASAEPLVPGRRPGRCREFRGLALYFSHRGFQRPGATRPKEEMTPRPGRPCISQLDVTVDSFYVTHSTCLNQPVQRLRCTLCRCCSPATLCLCGRNARLKSPSGGNRAAAAQRMTCPSGRKTSSNS